MLNQADDNPARTGQPEADFVLALLQPASSLHSVIQHSEFRTLNPQPARVLDAGCGTGRVAIALARRGIQVIGVDRDPRMIARARKAAGGVSWHLADLATLELHRRFDLVLLAGNVLLFVDPGTEGAVLAACARHLAPGGHLVTGFHLSTGYLTLPAYDALAAAAGLRLLARYAGWDRTLWASTASPVDQVISVHVIDQGPGNRDQTSR